MNLQTALRLSLVFGVVSVLVNGTACGASPTTKPEQPAATVGFAPPVSPELQAADERVKQAESQLDVAKKQLSAAKSLLRAAEADLKAAKADKQALALRTAAAGLATEAGMQAPRSLAQQVSGPPTGSGLTQQEAAAPARSMDFNAETMSQPAAEPSTFPIQLR
jgi:hypothetical protein